MIELTIDLEQADYHQYVIRANFDEGLQGNYVINYKIK
jgi:hypothetical protein